jgi:hypothetical protein
MALRKRGNLPDPFWLASTMKPRTNSRSLPLDGQVCPGGRQFVLLPTSLRLPLRASAPSSRKQRRESVADRFDFVALSAAFKSHFYTNKSQFMTHSNHKNLTASIIALSLLASLCPDSAEAHVSYTGRTFGTFGGGEPTVILGFGTTTAQAATGNFGWADGTDADFGDSHKLRAFRFTLTATAVVTLSFTGSDNGGAALLGLNPGFSIYLGLAHISPAAADHDFATISQSYLASLPGVAKEGAFTAMDTWKMGNDTGLTFADLSTFTYMGHAADGSSANYGPASGIQGDGLLDGKVTGTFNLGPGDYTVFVGGADYASQSDANAASAYGVIGSITVIPEPSSGLAMVLGLGLMVGRRRRPGQK